ncbi:hypothetical protein QBK99_24115 [Corticibacterium sp. UT-5YL-CI-8]|nr:hypothetical protein [Tianweitania sp. UT-5YL-CI-8]
MDDIVSNFDAIASALNENANREKFYVSGSVITKFQPFYAPVIDVIEGYQPLISTSAQSGAIYDRIFPGSLREGDVAITGTPRIGDNDSFVVNTATQDDCIPRANIVVDRVLNGTPRRL